MHYLPKEKEGYDLVQPACGQCVGRGIACGGYDSDRIFIYQRGGSNRSAPKGDTSPTPKTYVDEPSRHSFQIVPATSVSAIEVRNPSFTSVSILPPAGLAKSAYSQKTIAAFLDMYNPAGTIETTNVDAKELVTLLPMLSTRDEALQMAALAVGIAQLGITTKNEHLTRQGRALYGKALKETAVALRNPARANSESILVVPRVMALFELLFGAEPQSANQAKSWLSHAVGELAIIVSRGPAAFATDDVAHNLFTNARYRLLGPAIRCRRATILNTEEWKTLPWQGRTKTSEDLLVDILCGIPEILEAVDRLQYESMDSGERSAPGTWAQAEANVIYTPEIADTCTQITFPNIDVACITVRYWLTSLFLYSSLDIAAGIDLSTDFSLSHPDRPHPRPFARMITRSVDYFMQEKFGVTGLVALWFPLGNTLFYLNRNREADVEYIKTIMKAWNQPKLPSVMRDFLMSFRMTVDMTTLLATPIQGL
ncbi:uncharacterized protein SETTUDRAFT_32615 [Exserohilum turcica Et28A]|uniref:Uncharacterized protein n=1 Tax=Exserohilum turcicum (strain 28A) TaxID=671987 RepID=R0K796_EXST2|nr:uncharacterized protein SETTUDRAFT_32615 [Exserohilum turcica Et28A]EOA85409.1 hypothetical protein SETTUDRAFT_32615 [Exserohilum turcica Et28A]